jgi:hypothetical protein
MRLSRMTTRRWVLVVGGIALAVAIGVCLERRAYYLRMARDQARWVQFWSVRRNKKIPWEPYKGHYMFNPELFNADETLKEEYVKEFEKTQAYYHALEKKYQYAASHPWVYVEPESAGQ